jgi:hyperosmotically inducible periplasmic protein
VLRVESKGGFTMNTSSTFAQSWLGSSFLICAAGCLMFLSAQSSTTNSLSTAPDNTKANKTDISKPTADQQKQNKADIQITQKIRKAIEDDKTLSIYAKNVKIVAQNGDVTLSGPVRSADEKTSIEAKAVQVAGTGHVKNQIEIAPPKTSDQKK